jgi:hypothetical protein
VARVVSSLLCALVVAIGCGAPEVFARYEGSLQGTIDRRPGVYGCLFLKADDGYVYDFHFLEASSVFEENGLVIDRARATVAKPGDRVEVTGEVVHYSREGPTVASPVGRGPAGCLSWSIEVQSIVVAP